MVDLAKYFHTIRHLRGQQVLGQFRNRFRPTVKKSYNDVPPKLEVNGLPETVMVISTRAAAADAAGLRAGLFNFMHVTHDLGWPPDWMAVDSDLWGFHLHYFGYIHALKPTEQEELCLNWIERNQIGIEPAWHPFPTSLRLINWCKARLTHPEILSSIYRQASFLHDHLETHLMGNHLLENARALITAGTYLHGQGAAESWVRTGRYLYEEQTTEQILADGGHVERSPMYHALMLKGYLDVINLLEESGYPVRMLKGAAERMRGWLGAMVDPDGNIALFNDAAYNGTPSIAKLMRYADRVLGPGTSHLSDQPHPPESNDLQFRHLESSGYVSISDRDLFFVFDGGPVGPDYLPAHAHADIFSFVLHADGQPWIVDTGTSTYDSGPIRRYERSTRAHNAVTVDDVDQVECWGAFRVARRFTPKCQVERINGQTVQIDGTYDGYATLIGDDIVHSRRVTVRHDCREVEVVDRVTGRGHHRVSSRIHLHPDVDVRRDGTEIRLVTEKPSRTSSIVMSIVDSPVRVEKGMYAPEFGSRRETKCLILERGQVLPVILRYTIYY